MTFRIETPRLCVRPWETTDRSVFGRFVTDAEMMRYINHGLAWDQARMDAYFERQGRNLARHGCCVGAVVSRQSDAVIGMGGIQPLEQAGIFELAWWIWKDYWNRGLATEMAQACKDYAFNAMQLPQVVAIIDPPNLASIRVAEKLGMRNEGLRNAHHLADRYPEIEVLLFSFHSSAGRLKFAGQKD
jgi:RimJ/RimL family protein N-acetyltransferase